MGCREILPCSIWKLFLRKGLILAMDKAFGIAMAIDTHLSCTDITWASDSGCKNASSLSPLRF